MTNGEIQDGARPVPDPTVLTTEALARGLQAERDYTNGIKAVLEQRLDGIDKATEVLNETVNRVPTALQEGLGHLEAVMDERFISIATQFKERDTRSERESRDNKVAVDAAFAAQKEAAAKQDESNAKAIDKSEKATNETIKTLGDANAQLAAALGDKIDDLKGRVTRIESGGLGALQERKENRENNNAQIDSSTKVFGAIIGVAVVLLSSASLYVSAHHNNASPTIVCSTTAGITRCAPQ